ncbi:GLPGLI family protein [Bacteroides neonati]|uniref:GLPGLI family protein n=1 Tax=Bacteroides neonati TaxID=1347393 RepID=UPI0016526178|nr:GLPGLI family protein [Bacteroides neonati]
MKYYLFIVIVWFGFHDLYSQKRLDNAHIKCQYRFLYTKDTLSQKKNDDLLILQIGTTISKCYSHYSNQVDSILAMPNYYEIMREHLNNAFSKKKINTNDYPHKRMKTYVYKNYPQRKMTVTDGLSLQDYIYEDELNAQDWQISDSIKTILDYPCQKAECTFRGRQWIAWFAPNIPVSDGPWKFGGLPGLIMEVYDLKQQYYFTMIGLQKVEKEPIVFSQTYVGSKKFEKTNRKDFLKAQKRYLMDMSGYIELETGIDLGSNSPQKVMRYDLIELDYK